MWTKGEGRWVKGASFFYRPSLFTLRSSQTMHKPEFTISNSLSLIDQCPQFRAQMFSHIGYPIVNFGKSHIEATEMFRRCTVTTAVMRCRRRVEITTL
jgi:hypothetical protein